MLIMRYLLIITGIGLLAGAAGILLWDLYQILIPRTPPPETRPPFRWRAAANLAAAAVVPLLAGLAIALVPAGRAGVRVSQFSGTLPGTLYPGVHFVVPGFQSIALYNIRDQMFTTSLAPPKKNEAPAPVFKVQTREGLSVGLAITVRYRLDPRKLAYIHSNLAQPVEQEMVAPAVASVFRDIAPHYLVREIFSTRRDAMRREAAGAIAKKLGADGIVVKEVDLRDIQLPPEYARGLEGLLLKEQENERMSIELEVKAKMVREAELEADAQKAREIKEAEARAQVTVLEAKAQADAMQHTLPLKQKQIEQTRLEAQARKESTVQNAEAQAQAKLIDSKAELERRRLMSDAEDYEIRRVAEANAERMKLEAAVLKDNPLIIQKIIAEKLSDKVRIMMVPSDGKFFFANDVLQGMATMPVQH